MTGLGACSKVVTTAIAACAAVISLSACDPGPPRVAAPAPPVSAPVVITLATLSEGGWPSLLPEIFDGMEACRFANPFQPASVVDVQPLEAGLLRVYTIGASSRIYSCLAAGSGGEPLWNQPLVHQEAFDGPIYRPVAAGEPEAQCAEREPVREPEGGLVGWVLAGPCALDEVDEET